MNLFKNLEAVHRHVARGLDAELHLIAVDSNDDYANRIADHYRLIGFAA
jgi:hypothetical protein